MNRKDKRRVARLRMEKLHAGKKATRLTPPKPETPPERDTPPESETPPVVGRAPGFPNIEQ